MGTGAQPEVFDGRVVRVDLEVVDCLAVGFTLRAVSKGERMPASTRDIYARVGEQLVSAARTELENAGVLQPLVEIPPRGERKQKKDGES